MYLIKTINKGTMNKKGQAVIIGSIFLILALMVVFIAMPFLAEFIAVGKASITQPFVKLLMDLFPVMLFVILLIAFLKIARSE